MLISSSQFVPFLGLILAIGLLAVVLLYLMGIARQQQESFADLLDELKSLRSEFKKLQNRTPSVPMARRLEPLENPQLGKTSEEPKAEVPKTVAPNDSPVTIPKEVEPEAAPSLETLLRKRVKARQIPNEPIPEQKPGVVQETLRKIWNWIIVGDENLPPGVSLEYAIASQWLLRLGILILVLGIGFFIRYSINHGLLNEYGRVGIAAVAGFGMIFGGTRLLGQKYHVFGQGLLGGGLATLYFAVFASANFYKLIEPSVAFAFMSLVTLLAGAIAVRFNSILVAVLGIIGGYGTPIMLSTGEVNFPGLNGYLLILGVGVLGICYWKEWLLVNYLSFLCTYALVLLSLKDYKPELFWQEMPFLIAFFVLFSTMTFLHKLVNRKPANLLDVLASLINAMVFFGIAANLIDERYGQKAVAWLSLGLAGFFTVHAIDILKRKLLDRGLLITFVGLAAFFLTVTMPILLNSEWISSSWAILALCLLWMAGMLGSEFLRHLAYLLFGIVLLRLSVFDLPTNFLNNPSSADVPIADYLRNLLDRAFHFGIPIGALFGGCWLTNRQQFPVDRLVKEANDTPAILPPAFAFNLGLIFSVGFLFLLLNIEFFQSFGYLYAPIQLPALTILWLGLITLMFTIALQRKSESLMIVLMIFLFATLFKLLVFDLPSWGLSSEFLYTPPYSFRDALMRLVDFGAVIGFLTVAFVVLGGREKLRDFDTILGITAVAVLFVYSSLELNSFLKDYLDGLRLGGISILWSVFAFSLILRGIIKHSRWLRYAGLSLFAIVIFKVFFNDLARLDQFYRIIAFLVLGLVVLSGSFIYLKFRETFADKPSE